MEWWGITMWIFHILALAVYLRSLAARGILAVLIAGLPCLFMCADFILRSLAAKSAGLDSLQKHWNSMEGDLWRAVGLLTALLLALLRYFCTRPKRS